MKYKTKNIKQEVLQAGGLFLVRRSGTLRRAGGDFKKQDIMHVCILSEKYSVFIRRTE